MVAMMRNLIQTISGRQMLQKSIFQSEVTEVPNYLAETFGRGCAIKYREPSFSERNNFELQKMNQAQEKQKRQMPTFLNELMHDHSPLQAKQSKDFQKIDAINNKICGLIKSISASCHKKMPIDTNSKYQEQVRARLQGQPHKPSKIKYQEPKKKHSVQLDPNPKPMQESKQSKFTVSNWHLHDQSSKEQSQNYDEMHERIQKINEKISNYESKINRGDLKEYRNYGNAKITTPKKEQKSQGQIKMSQNKMRYILNEKENASREIFLEKAEGRNQEKSQAVNRKLGYFHEKFSQTDIKKPLKEQPYKQHSKHKPKPQKQPQHLQPIQPTKSLQLPHFNSQLLAYKTTFIKQLIKQISLDQDFRHSKHMFGGIQDLFGEDSTSTTEKWNRLQRLLKNEGFSMSLSQVREIFMPRDDEIDPFMSVSHSHQELIHGVIFAYRVCEKNWNENMYHSWSLWELKESKFTAENIGRKGNLTLQDLTFYINTQLDGSYRNRDLLLIFNRLKPHPKTKSDQPIRYRDVLDKLISA